MNIFSVVAGGVALGFQDPNEKYLWFKTFISDAMLNPSQRALVKDIEEQNKNQLCLEKLQKNFIPIDAEAVSLLPIICIYVYI